MLDNAVTFDESTPIIDVSEFDFELPTELTNAHGLEFFEQRAIGSAETMIKSRTDFAYSVHMILENRLYQHAYDLSGGPFQYADDYLRAFSHRCFVGVSTMKAYHSAIRMARHLGYDAGRIADLGIYVFTEVSKKVKKNRASGAPEKLSHSNYQPPDLDDYLVETIEELASNKQKPDVAYRPVDFRAELERRLEIGKPRIWFERISGGRLKWVYERTNEQMTLDLREGELTFSMTGNPPQEVYDRILKALRLEE